MAVADLMWATTWGGRGWMEGECVDMAGIRRRYRRRRQEAQAAAEWRSWRDVAQAQWRAE
jgi:hypothetical protein